MLKIVSNKPPLAEIELKDVNLDSLVGVVIGGVKHVVAPHFYRKEGERARTLKTLETLFSTKWNESFKEDSSLRRFLAEHKNSYVFGTTQEMLTWLMKS